MAYCENCGNKLSETAIFCSNCGQKVKEHEESILHENSYENQVPDNSNSLKSTENDLHDDKKDINLRHKDNKSFAKDLSSPLMEEAPKVLHSVKEGKIIKTEKGIPTKSDATIIESNNSNQIEDSQELRNKGKETTNEETNDIKIYPKRKLIDQNYIYPQIFAYLGIFTVIISFSKVLQIDLRSLGVIRESMDRFLTILTFIPDNLNNVLLLIVKLALLLSLRKYCQNFGQSGIKILFLVIIIYEIFLFANSQFYLIIFINVLGYYILEIIDILLFISIGVILVRANDFVGNLKLSGIALIINYAFGIISMIYYSQNGLESQKISDTILLSFFLSGTSIFYLYCIKNVFKRANEYIKMDANIIDGVPNKLRDGAGLR